MSRFLATVFFVGLLRPAPGTWGSAAALPMAFVLSVLGGPWVFGLAIVLVFGLGIYVTAVVSEASGDPDPSEVVIDEVVGQWIALLPVVVGAARVGADPLMLWPGWLAAFLAFRLFDIWKPGPVRWADRRGDALGVMLDDVIAGALAAATVLAAAIIAHGMLAA